MVYQQSRLKTAVKLAGMAFIHFFLLLALAVLLFSATVMWLALE